MIEDIPAATDRRVKERGRVDAATFEREIVPVYEPVVLRGQVSDWPACAAGQAGPRAMADYLVQFGGGKPLEVLVAAPEVGGRYFYSDDMSGFNFSRQNVALSPFVAELVRLAEEKVEAPHALYASAATAPDHMPGWAEANRLDLPATGATPRLWIGNAVQVATHYDNSANLAAVVAGRRRFTLFPPEQVANLYLGPLERTLAGPPNSMVDPEAPDLARYPRYAEALKYAQVAELKPGDVLFIPAIWWHHVRSFDAFNLLVNYWWTQHQTVSPFPAMIHAMLALRDLPPPEKNAWRAWFDHVVFDDDAASAGDHLPEAARGVLGADTPERTRNILGYLRNMLGQA
ncbi:cupin-like domain-containing protein [Sphingomonas koreensis]|nr:cupin-like domain-containing protein [Sphingomonas koreensis]